VLDLLSELNRDSGKTVVMVLHDVNLAAEYADHVFVLRDGKLLDEGTAESVLTASNIKEVFGIESHVTEHPLSGRPLILPVRPHHLHRLSAQDRVSDDSTGNYAIVADIAPIEMMQ
jgi:ABC-type cobalamin/Fe3+-siderophores transport system ATPase subunit